jgi:hypothetical protein
MFEAVPLSDCGISPSHQWEWIWRREIVGVFVGWPNRNSRIASLNQAASRLIFPRPAALVRLPGDRLPRTYPRFNVCAG